MKKRTIFFLGLLLTASISFAQDSKFSASVSYPVTISDVLFDNYSGVLDVGLGYKFYNNSKLSAGLLLNSNLYSKKEDFSAGSSIKESLHTLQPRGFVEYNIGKTNKLKPFVGIGYSIVFLKVDVRDPNNAFNGDSVEKDNKGFVNLNFGISYDMLDNLFLIAQFDYLSRSNKNGLMSYSIPNKMETIKLGIGYRF